MHEVVRSQRAARRAGTHDTLTRGQVRGGGKKPRARRGALAVLVRARFVLHNGQVAVPYSVLILAPMPLRFLQR